MTTKQRQDFNLMVFTLGRIAKDYQTPDQLRSSSKKTTGLDYEEALEMAYENIQGEAQALVKKIKPIADSSSNMVAAAKLELSLLPKKNLLKELEPELIALVEKYATMGHSGGSSSAFSPVVAETVKRLLNFEPLGPIMGTDEEFMVIQEDLKTPEVISQNRRCGVVFKDQEGKAWYLDAIQWKTQHGRLYGGPAFMPDGSKIWGRQYIKAFPFTPKTFQIDVIEKEVKPDDWEFTVKDEAQLAAVWEYYDRYYFPDEVKPPAESTESTLPQSPTQS